MFVAFAEDLRGESELTEVDGDGFIQSVFVDVDKSSRNEHSGANAVEKNSNGNRRICHESVRRRNGRVESDARIAVPRILCVSRTQFRQKVFYHVWNGS